MALSFEQFKDEFNGAPVELEELAHEMVTNVDDVDCQVIAQAYLSALKSLEHFLHSNDIYLG